MNAFSAALAKINRFMKRGQPIPAELHERTVRLGLSVAPDDRPSIYSLIALLHLSGRAPFPDSDILAAAASWQSSEAGKAASQEGPDDLLEKANEHAAAALIWDVYTCLWRAVIRCPDSARPWAEYARHLTEDGEWRFAAAAAQFALAHPQSADPQSARPLLAALATLAEEQRLGDLNWRSWLDRLPDDLATSGAALTLLLRTNDRAEAVERLPRALAKANGDFMFWLSASKIAYEENRMSDSYEHLRRAFEQDFKATLHSVVRHWSGPATLPANRLNKTDEFVDWLDDLSRAHPGVNLIPATASARSLAIVQEQRAKAQDRGLPSAFLITQGKSGSVSVANFLGSGFGLPTALYSLIQERVVPSWLSDYLTGGANYVTHLLPLDINVKRLAEGGAKRVIVHVRDPRQIAVSMAHHMESYPAYLQPDHGATGGTGLKTRLEFVVDAYMKGAVEWIEYWHAARSRLEVEFTTFEEFVTDQDAFCDRLVGLYGGDTRYFDRSAAFYKPPNTDFHIRRGETDEWRRELTAQQADRINAMFPDHFWKTFNWKP